MTVRVEIVVEVKACGPAGANEFYMRLQEGVMDVLRETGARPVSMKMREVRPDGSGK